MIGFYSFDVIPYFVVCSFFWGQRLIVTGGVSHNATLSIGSVVQSFHIIHMHTSLYLCLANHTLDYSWLKVVSDQSQDRAISRVLSNIPIYHPVAFSVHDVLIVFRVVSLLVACLKYSLV